MIKYYLKTFHEFLKPCSDSGQPFTSFMVQIPSFIRKHDEPFNNPFGNILAIAWVGN